MNVWHEILEIAAHAPSPHNVQPWKVKILSATAAELFIDSTRTLPKEDTTGSFIILSMGIFLESLSLVAAQKGLKLSYELLREPAWYAPAILEIKNPTLLPFAKMKLVQGGKTEDFYEEQLFFKRRTSRLSLLPKGVPPEISVNLRNLAAQYDQQYVEIIDNQKIERVLGRNIEAVFDDLNSHDYQEELVSWFRFSDKESAEKRDGLDYRCMNSSKFNFKLAARHPRLLQVPGVRQIMKRSYRRQLGTVPTIGALAGRFWDPRDALQAGCFLMRFWLETAKFDLYMHPYGNLVTNKSASVWWRNETGILDAWLIFKIGYSTEPPKSHRLPLEKILIN